MVPSGGQRTGGQFCNEVSLNFTFINKKDNHHSGYGFGSSIWIPLETAFINPDDVPPESPNCLITNSTDVECSDKYFLDEDLLKRSSTLNLKCLIPQDMKFPGFRTVSS